MTPSCDKMRRSLLKWPCCGSRHSWSPPSPHGTPRNQAVQGLRAELAIIARRGCPRGFLSTVPLAGPPPLSPTRPSHSPADCQAHWGRSGLVSSAFCGSRCNGHDRPNCHQIAVGLRTTFGQEYAGARAYWDTWHVQTNYALPGPHRLRVLNQKEERTRGRRRVGFANSLTSTPRPSAIASSPS